MKRAVIFDYGGVLMKTVDYEPRHAWDERLSLPRGRVEAVVHGSSMWQGVQRGQVSIDDYWADVARQLQLDTVGIEALQHDFYAGDRLDDDLIGYIRELCESGHSVALLSNAPVGLHDELRGLGIERLFDPLVISAHIGVMKPDPAAYQSVLDALGRPADETIFIDDMPANIEGAKSLGIHGILYVAGMDLRAALEPLLE